MEQPDFSLEESFGAGLKVAGVDEVGYGAWAGPIVVAAVIINRDLPLELFEKVKDSKKVPPSMRLEIVRKFSQHPGLTYHLVWIEPEIINGVGVNVLSLTLDAGAQAACHLQAQAVVMDGKHPLPLCLPQRCEPKGDQKSFSIALASLFAKVVRDERMNQLHQDHPVFGWNRNKGYGTWLHEQALATHGLTPHHRTQYCQKALSRHGL